MNKLALGTALSALFLFLNTPAQAEWLIKGHQLKAQCELDATHSEWTFCDGYVVGVAESLKLGGGVCQPDDIAPTDLSKIVLAYLRGHEDVLNQVSFALVGRALKEAYPCPDKQP